MRVAVPTSTKPTVLVEKNTKINKLIFAGCEQTQSEITASQRDVSMKNSFGTTRG